ncbi:hypothetical protein AVEN_35966-1 [Araneus ventricosus]|uniref:Uncharacterized protein n=1 Tax=Araneus ventricosus TaxID=182803 RepID=A0A4Y2U9T3_ARAVE|nr:hypothetical protein AVEN_35966-1 [Araneus ventricosus]
METRCQGMQIKSPMCSLCSQLSRLPQVPLNNDKQINPLSAKQNNPASKSFTAAAARQNVNKPETSSINVSQNANPSRVLHEITTPLSSGKPIMNEVSLPSFTELPAMLANMNDVMGLLVQFFSQLLEDKGPLSLNAFSTLSLIRTRSTLSSMDFHDNLPTYEEPKCVNQRFSQHIGSSKLSEIYKKPAPQTR